MATAPLCLCVFLHPPAAKSFVVCNVVACYPAPAVACCCGLMFTLHYAINSNNYTRKWNIETLTKKGMSTLKFMFMHITPPSSLCSSI